MRKLWIQVVVLSLTLVAVLMAKHYVNRFVEDSPAAAAPPAAVGGTSVSVEPPAAPAASR